MVAPWLCSAQLLQQLRSEDRSSGNGLVLLQGFDSEQDMVSQPHSETELLRTQTKLWHLETELMRTPGELWPLHDAKIRWPLSGNNIISGTWDEWWKYYRVAENKYSQCRSAGSALYQVALNSHDVEVVSGACLSRVPSRAFKQARVFLRSRMGTLHIYDDFNFSISRLAHWKELELDW
eukprot:CAMPEP_0180668474 /NCGR_PEP_ID=MMETSP1037_2-20121125/62943_1 /TAXON_ID=632150 /ORGANISM="Azadinium spinosum, Strain 3D9" /LENGTH=178 /DNA_ID=CAMNT_0022697203 /DNA_START=21 /DNA_END=555 /DNA_ORIENTATION=+